MVQEGIVSQTDDKERTKRNHQCALELLCRLPIQSVDEGDGLLVRYMDGSSIHTPIERILDPPGTDVGIRLGIIVLLLL